MKEVENLPLSKLVTLKPEAASILEKYNLDFCCRGKQTLSEALADDGDKLMEVKKSLSDLFLNAENKSETHFENYSLTELINYILEKHHYYIRETSPLILSHLNKVVSKHGIKHPELVEIQKIFVETALELEYHMMKEENILFPRIKMIEDIHNNKRKESKIILIEAPVQVMELEHEAAGNNLNEIKKLTGNYSAPVDACTTFKLVFEELKNFELDLHKHVHLENNILFPKAINLQSKLKELIYS